MRLDNEKEFFEKKNDLEPKTKKSMSMKENVYNNFLTKENQTLFISICNEFESESSNISRNSIADNNINYDNNNKESKNNNVRFK